MRTGTVLLLALSLLPLSGAFGDSFRLDVGPTGSAARALAPVVADEGLERIELSDAAVLTQSQALYVLTKDLFAPGTAFTIQAGLRNTVLDLGGHVVTYNTARKQPDAGRPYPYNEAVPGISIKGRGIENIVIRNGIILQGAGGNAGSHAISLNGGKAIEIHHIQSRVHGPDTRNIAVVWGGADGRVHDNYLENRSRKGMSGGIVVSQSAPGWDIYNNTIIGGHRSIAIWNNATRKNQFSKAKIHHNLLSPRRVHGLKAPQGILCFGSAGNEVFENEISTDDARGINLQGRGSGHNHVHHNLIACRYSSKATEGNYVENRCYGYWERDGVANRLTDNVWIVGNEVTGDRTSNTVGILATTTGGRLTSAEYARNRVICSHVEGARDVIGFAIKRSDEGVVLDANEIIARTSAIRVFASSDGVRLKQNTCFRAAGAGKDAAMLDGDDIDKCVREKNVATPFDAAAGVPAAPTGLRAVRRHEAVELRWNRCAWKTVTGYNIYCDGKKVNPYAIGGRFYVHLDVRPPAAHVYHLSAVDLSGRESPRSAPLVVVQK